MVQSAKIGERAGQRTVLLWVLWIVMTLLLLAAGVAVLGGEVPAPVRTGAGAVMGAGALSVAAADAGAVVARAPARQLIDAGPGNEVAVRARVRLRLDIGDGHSVPWPRRVHVGVAAFGAGADPTGRGDWLGQEPPPVPWTFAVPAGTAMLRFHANGFLVEAVAMPVARDGIADLGNVTLRAEAAIRLRLLHVPAVVREGAVATVHTSCYGNARLAALPLTWRGDCGEALLPAPTGCSLSLHVQWPARGGLALRLPDEIEHAVSSLQRGETRLCEVDVAALPACTLRLTGIASELLPHVEIAMYEPGRRGQMLTADAAGRVQLLGLPMATASLLVHGAADQISLRDAGLHCVLALSAGATYELQPDQPLVGIGMRDGNGRTVAFGLRLDRPADLDEARPVQIVGEQQLRGAETMFVATDDALRMLPPSALLGTGPMRWITPAALTALATLRVRPTTPLPEQHGFCVGFEPLDAAGDEGSLTLQGEVFRSEQMRPGRYRIALWYRDSRAFDVAADIDLRPGSVTELPLALPAVCQWRGEIANWSELPEALRPHQVVLDRQRVTVGKDGSFRWWRAGALAADAAVSVDYFQSSQRLTGRMLEVDPSGRRVRIEAPSDQVALQLHAQPLGQCAWYAVALAGGGEVVESQYGEFWLPAPSIARGYVYETLRGSNQVTAWFALPAGTSTASIPTGVDAHWLTVAVQRPVRRVIVRVRGPADQPAVKIAELWQRGEVHVLVVAGTRSIEVETDGVVQSFDAANGDIVIR